VDVRTYSLIRAVVLIVCFLSVLCSVSFAFIQIVMYRLSVGTPLYASHFRVGDYVDVQAKT